MTRTMTTFPTRSRALLPTLCSLILLLGGCLAPKGPVGVPVSGKMTYLGDPAARVALYAIPADSLSLDPKGSAVTAITDADGTYRTSMPAGSYYFLAGNDERFSYFGRNPVEVPPAGLHDLNLALVSRAAETTPLDPFIDEGICGRVTSQGEPVKGAMIFVYTDLSTQLKGMGYAIAGPTDPDGYFEIPLSAGTYYLIARQRQGDSPLGPLRAGDFFGYLPQNPVTTTTGKVASLTIPLLEVPAKIETSIANLETTVISGRILDAEGNPVAGLRALLYDNAQMFNRPLKVSHPTGDDGRFSIHLSTGGTFWLAARNSLGGAPGPGDLFGAFEGNPDHSVNVETDTSLEGIEIRVEEMW